MRDYQVSCDTVIALGTGMSILGWYLGQWWVIFGGIILFMMGVGNIPPEKEPGTDPRRELPIRLALEAF